MSGLPSPLKSPTLTSSQLTDVLHVSQSWSVKLPPLESATYQSPTSSARPMMSARPSPLKSATLTSTHVTPVPQTVHSEVTKLPKPVFKPTYHWPVDRSRPAMSSLPSPLKSPVRTSAHVGLVLHVAQREDVKAVPLESPTYHWPRARSRPMTSAFPSPLKSPTLRSTHVTDGLHDAHRVVVKVVPLDSPTHHSPV